MDRRAFVLKGVGAVAGLGMAGAIAACGGSDGPTDPGGNGGNGGGGGGGGGDNTVSVGDNFFSPANLTIEAGETVTWEHNGNALHNIVPDGHSAWDDREFPPGSSDFTVTFNSTGTFPYVCEYHPGMDGTITVEASG